MLRPHASSRTEGCRRCDLSRTRTSGKRSRNSFHRSFDDKAKISSRPVLVRGLDHLYKTFLKS
jgi:hypothetical protein